MTRSADDILADLLAECSELILAGATVQACLDQYPQHAAALAPLLSSLLQVRQLRPVPARPADAIAQGRAQFMAAVYAGPGAAPAQQQTQPRSWGEQVTSWWQGLLAGLAWPTSGRGLPRSMPAGLLATLLLVILAGVLITGVMTTSARALPGDFLYPVKTAVEGVQVFAARSPEDRSALLEELAARRVEEAQRVVTLGRPVPSMALQGKIDAINGNLWTVSGLIVTITPDTGLEGTPMVGAQVQGRMRAPGDGSLVALYIEAEAPPPDPGLVMPTPTATVAPSLTRQPLTATPTATPTSTPAAAALELPVLPFVEPEELPTFTPTPVPTATPTRTPRPTAAPTATAPATFTPTPYPTPPREQVKQSLRGWVESIDGSRWTVDDTSFNTDARTQYIGDADIGWQVDVTLLLDANGLTALQIIALVGPEAIPEPVEFTDVLKSIDGEWWTIGSFRVKIVGSTQIEDDPKIGELLEVKAERRAGGEIWALRIRPIRAVEVQFQGIIDAVNSSSVVIDGHLVLIDGETQIAGELTVGRVAQVAAMQWPDGRVIARLIVVQEPKPTATPTSTATPTLEPTATPALEPTSTPTPEPTATPTEVPTP